MHERRSVQAKYAINNATQTHTARSWLGVSAASLHCWKSNDWQSFEAAKYGARCANFYRIPQRRASTMKLYTTRRAVIITRLEHGVQNHALLRWAMGGCERAWASILVDRRCRSVKHAVVVAHAVAVRCQEQQSWSFSSNVAVCSHVQSLTSPIICQHPRSSKNNSRRRVQGDVHAATYHAVAFSREHCVTRYMWSN